MSLLRLQVTQLRNLNWVDILPSRDLNIIFGNNGSGKSSLLEAIHLLALGRSFRSNSIKNVISHNCPSLTVYAEVNSSGHRLSVGIEREVGSGRIRIDGKNAHSLSELLSILPLQFIGPDIQRSIESGPKFRRTLLDWGVFHVEHGFYPCWLRYKKLLKQRNAALKKREHHETIVYWDGEIVKAAESLNAFRDSYLNTLSPLFEQQMSELATDNSIIFKLNRGWPKDESLADTLAKSLNRDIKSGFTAYGPHRADLIFSNEDGRVQDELSRGQLKLLVIAFKIAQVQLLQKLRNQRCVILLDDLPSELDSANRAKVMNSLLASDAQIFVTTTDKGHICYKTLAEDKEKKMFHVEQGLISEVI